MKVFVDASMLIYLNTWTPEDDARKVEELWLDLIKHHELYTNVLVLHEVIYISARKYKVPVKDTIEFIDNAVLPYTSVLPIGLKEYMEAKRLMFKARLKPSDAIHAASIMVNGLDAIVSEDSDFDKVGIRRIWVRA